MSQDKAQGRLVAGTILIVTGLALYFFLQGTFLRAEVLLLVIGAVLFSLYFIRRNPGLLVPGAILLGLGAGLTWHGSFLHFGNAAQLGLGLGFIGIWLVRLLYEGKNEWWPLIPGGILVLAGLPWFQSWAAFLLHNWPLLLVILGVLILLGGLRGFLGGRGS
jgi:hypothetical protein